jgi:hypothetical protein
MQAAFPALCRHSQDTQNHQHLGEGSRLRDGRGRNRLDDGRGHVADTKLLVLELPQGPALFTECLEWRLPLPLRSRSFGEPCP